MEACFVCCESPKFNPRSMSPRMFRACLLSTRKLLKKPNDFLWLLAMCFGIGFGIECGCGCSLPSRGVITLEVVRIQILKTSDHGIPQKRKRMFLVAIRIDSINPAIANVDTVWPTPLQRKAGSMLHAMMPAISSMFAAVVRHD